MHSFLLASSFDCPGPYSVCSIKIFTLKQVIEKEPRRCWAVGHLTLLHFSYSYEHFLSNPCFVYQVDAKSPYFVIELHLLIEQGIGINAKLRMCWIWGFYQRVCDRGMSPRICGFAICGPPKQNLRAQLFVHYSNGNVVLNCFFYIEKTFTADLWITRDELWPARRFPREPAIHEKKSKLKKMPCKKYILEYALYSMFRMHLGVLFKSHLDGLSVWRPRTQKSPPSGSLEPNMALCRDSQIQS